MAAVQPFCARAMVGGRKCPGGRASLRKSLRTDYATWAHESYDLLSLSVAEWFLAHRNVDSASGAAGGGVSLDAFMAFFTLDRWGRIIGMFEQNQVGVRVPSPIGALVNKLHLLAVPLRQQVAKELLDIARRAGACDDEHSEDSSGDDDSSRYDSSTGERREGNLVGAAADR